MSASLFLRRLHCLRPSLPLNLTTPCAASIYRLFCTATTQAPLPSNPQFTVEYLIESVGLSSDEAIRASKKIQHLKSPDKPDAMLRFLRQTGISESDILTAVSRDPRLLCSSVENNLKPNIAKLQEVGLSIEDISGIISHFPGAFLFNIVAKVDFWMQALGSVENVSFLLHKRAALLNSNLEKVIMPNLSFLKGQCGLSVRQIVRLIRLAPFLIHSKPEALEIKANRAEELGVARAKPMFMYVLVVVGFLNQSTIDAKLLYLRSFGLSPEEVTLMISKAPLLLLYSQEIIGCKMEFLLKEAGCDKFDVVRNPALLSYGLKKRLIPRTFIRKLLMSKGLTVANKAFVSFMNPTKKQFVEKFVLPYEDAIPGLHQAYADACVEKIGAIE